MDEHLLRLMNTSLRIKEELKVKRRKNTSKLVKFEKLKKAQPGSSRTKAYDGAGA